jgi:histidinol-phosphate/aromatic aminotransferase/cobyric acid decarboxylase-like protein
MSIPFCHCQCKMRRAPGVRHCTGHQSCGAPRLSRPDAQDVVRAMRRLRIESGSHASSVAQIERAVPGLVQVDACFLSNPINALGEWFATLLCDPEFQQAYELARRRYVRDARRLFAELDMLPCAKVYPSAANYALLELDRTAAEVTSALLSRHGVYVRDCADKRGLEGGQRFIRVAARSQHENRRIVNALRNVLSQRALTA